MHRYEMEVLEKNYDCYDLVSHSKCIVCFHQLLTNK